MRSICLGIVVLSSCLARLAPKPGPGGPAVSGEPLELRAEAEENIVVAVVETFEGEPAAGAWVALNDPGGRLIAAVEADGNGRFRVPRPKKRFAVTVTSGRGSASARTKATSSSCPSRRTERSRPSMPPGEYFVWPQSSDVLAAGFESRAKQTSASRWTSLARLRVPAPREAVEWLATEAIELTSAVPEDPDDDLAPLIAALGDPRIIAVGEATHGTAEFFRIKHRLFKRLVAEHGVTVLAMEANVADAEVVDAYVRTGRGTANDALEHLFLVWQTEEVRDLLAWMRAHN